MGTSKGTPSETQLDALLRMIQDNGPLIRLPGGFWTTEATPTRMEKSHIGSAPYAVPEWRVSTHTVRAMEKRGWVRRGGRFEEHWRDDREITEEGREAALRAKSDLDPERSSSGPSPR